MDNHDNQRGHGAGSVLTFNSPHHYMLAQVGLAVSLALPLSLVDCVDSLVDCVVSLVDCVDSLVDCVVSLVDCVDSLVDCVNSLVACVDSLVDCVDSLVDWLHAVCLAKAGIHLPPQP